MRIISRRTLKEFWEDPKYRDAEQPLRAWISEAETADWKTSNDVKRQYASASVIGNNRVVFNIKGNSYRLVVAINYAYGIVYIRFIGTHEEYDKINVKEI